MGERGGVHLGVISGYNLLTNWRPPSGRWVLQLGLRCTERICRWLGATYTGPGRYSHMCVRRSLRYGKPVRCPPPRFKGGISGGSTVPQRPSTALRRNGQVALTVLRPTSAVVRGRMAEETAATRSAAGRGRGGSQGRSSSTAAGKLRPAASEGQEHQRDMALKVI